MKAKVDTERDVAEITIGTSDSVYGKEQLPGVVVFRDTLTDRLCSVELLFFNRDPFTWNMSLEMLGLGYLKEALKDLEANEEDEHFSEH